MFRKLLCSLTLVGFVCLCRAQNYNSLSLNSAITHVQPMTGIVFWSNNANVLNTLGNKVQLEYSYLVYNEVINQEDEYDWTPVDNLLSSAASRGHQMILRFRYAYPGETAPSVPDYIRETNGYQDLYETVENSQTFLPDWSSVELQDFTKEFFTAFAARYDKDPRLAFLQIGFGSYAEYHLSEGDRRLGENFPSKDYQIDFLQHVNTTFEETPWNISIDAASNTYSPFRANEALVDLNFGLFDDSFLHENHSISNNEYNRAGWLFFGESRANTNVAGGEFSYYSEYDQRTVLNEDGPYGFTFEEMADLYDITYMIGDSQLEYQSAERIEEAALATGYRFEVTTFETNGLNTRVTIRNNGIAPIYYDAFPTVNGVRSTTSLKGLVAGESQTFLINSVANAEDLQITSDRLVDGQEIQFDAAIEAQTLSVETILKEQLGITTFPNPVIHDLNIANPLLKKVTISIYDLQGSLYKKFTINAASKIHLEQLSAGVYVLQLKAGSYSQNKILVKK